MHNFAVIPRKYRSDLRVVGGRSTTLIPNPLQILSILQLTPSVKVVAKIMSASAETSR